VRSNLQATAIFESCICRFNIRLATHSGNRFTIVFVRELLEPKPGKTQSHPSLVVLHQP
jgi:hypothetical protein